MSFWNNDKYLSGLLTDDDLGPTEPPKPTVKVQTNGLYSTSGIGAFDVDVPQGLVPSGTLPITENGTYDVTEYASAEVDVPQGITPSGTLPITENGTYDVTEYASAEVDVPQGTTPSGTLPITENGTYDVTEYASAEVDVPQGITPTGNINITDTNVTDVTSYATATVVDADLVAENIKKDVNILGVVGSFEGSGTEIEHGAVWNAVTANGFPTEVTFYGTIIPKAFAYSYYKGWSAYMEKFNFHDEVTSIGEAAFYASGIKNIIIPESVSAFGNAVFQRSSLESIIFNRHMPDGLGGIDIFSDCTYLKNVMLPKVQKYGNRIFSSCPALETVQLGSIGYGITQFVNSTFAYTSSQATANVTIYTSGSIADTVLAAARYGLANSTIIIKASENTTYNGNAYSAGDTIITSEVS